MKTRQLPSKHQLINGDQAAKEPRLRYIIGILFTLRARPMQQPDSFREWSGRLKKNTMRAS
jgi:hypothetical protein